VDELHQGALFWDTVPERGPRPHGPGGRKSRLIIREEIRPGELFIGIHGTDVHDGHTSSRNVLCGGAALWLATFCWRAGGGLRAKHSRAWLAHAGHRSSPTPFVRVSPRSSPAKVRGAWGIGGRKFRASRFLGVTNHVPRRSWRHCWQRGFRNFGSRGRKNFINNEVRDYLPLTPFSRLAETRHEAASCSKGGIVADRAVENSRGWRENCGWPGLWESSHARFGPEHLEIFFFFPRVDEIALGPKAADVD